MQNERIKLYPTKPDQNLIQNLIQNTRQSAPWRNWLKYLNTAVMNYGSIRTKSFISKISHPKHRQTKPWYWQNFNLYERIHKTWLPYTDKENIAKKGQCNYLQNIVTPNPGSDRISICMNEYIKHGYLTLIRKLHSPKVNVITFKQTRGMCYVKISPLCTCWISHSLGTRYLLDAWEYHLSSHRICYDYLRQARFVKRNRWDVYN